MNDDISGVTINLPSSAFETFDVTGNKVKVCAGKYGLLYGNSSDDKDLKAIAMTVL